MGGLFLGSQGFFPGKPGFGSWEGRNFFFWEARDFLLGGPDSFPGKPGIGSWEARDIFVKTEILIYSEVRIWIIQCLST